METSALDSILSQLRAAKAATQGIGSAGIPLADTELQGSSFTQVLKNTIDSVNTTQLKTAEMQKAFELGEPGTDLQDVMVQMAKANISFQTMIQVRNRLVSAYQDMMNMPV